MPPAPKNLRAELVLLGRCLRQMRTARRLNQTEVALAAGTSQSQMSEIELGQTNVGWLMLTRIVNDGLGASFTEFAREYEHVAGSS